MRIRYSAIMYVYLAECALTLPGFHVQKTEDYQDLQEKWNCKRKQNRRLRGGKTPARPLLHFPLNSARGTIPSARHKICIWIVSSLQRCNARHILVHIHTSSPRTASWG